MVNTKEFSNTRCFIDADGTLFNSLIHYNVVIDQMVKGTLTDKNYIEYYQDFGDTYDIIPGSPWKTILCDLYEYLGETRPTGKAAQELIDRFEEGAVKEIKSIQPKDFVLQPIIDFCNEYKAGGGELIIHSGTNRVILEAMLEQTNISHLFTDYLCTNMLDVDSDTLGKWGYKTKLLQTLLKKYPQNGHVDFVIGDTKGDCFGAYECSLPFMLVWRGYPKNPYVITANDDGVETTIEAELAVDMRQEVIENSLIPCAEMTNQQYKRYYIDEMLGWCRNGCHKIPVEQQLLYKTYKNASIL